MRIDCLYLPGFFILLLFDQKSHILSFDENHKACWYIKGQLINVPMDQKNVYVWIWQMPEDI